MYRTWITACIALALATFPAAAAAQGPADAREAARAALEANPQLEYSPTTVLVRFDDALPANRRAAARAAVGRGLVHQYAITGLEQIEISMPVEQALAALRAMPTVIYAEPDYVVQTISTPNDPGFGQLWGMQNIRAPAAWNVTTGDENFIVAVIDSGVQYTHVDLAGNMWPALGWDFHNNGSNNDPWDENGHGTHIAGTIGAVGNNGIGVVGVNWQVQIMALRFLGPDGRGFISDATRALEFAVNNGAKISNNSWVGGGFSQSMYDMIDWAGSQGHLFVCAAGNSGSDIDRSHPVFSYAVYPPSYNLPNMISVAAIDSGDNLASFSNYGATTIHLGAPGVSIVSTYLNNGYATASGTSMAAPHVAGAAALYWGENPEKTMSEVRQQILGSVCPLSSLSGRTSTGGTLDAGAALGDQVGPGPAEPPPAPTGITGIALPGREALIEWQHDAEATDHLEIERWRRQGNTWRGATIIGPIAGTESSYIDSPGNGTYRYRVRAVNAAGNSAWSAFIELTMTN